MKLKFLAICLASLTISTGASANLIANGDFSAGFTGFASDYTPVPYPQDGALYPESTYTVGANPFLDHNLFVDLASNTNPMLLVNGATGVVNKAVLTYTSALLVAGSYVFKADVMNICCNETYTGGNAPSQLLFQISQDNGINWSDIASYTTSPPGDSGVLNSVTPSPFQAQSAFMFRIIDALTAAGGNDFAIDNLSIEAAAVPGPIAGAGLPGLVIALGGLVALARRRRSQATVA